MVKMNGKKKIKNKAGKSWNSKGNPKNKLKVVVAFSGGLDTSFCVAYLKDKGYDVYTITVDTGGFTHDELKKIESTAKKLGVAEHKTVDGKKEVYEKFASYIIKGNILRGHVYPLCVGAERIVQAQRAVEHAKTVSATAVCHGSTGAGNDQVRFDVAVRASMPEAQIIAPIRELEISRDYELQFLQKKGIEFPAMKKKYSINQGILGTTIGGGETHDSWETVPDEAYALTTSPETSPETASETAPDAVEIILIKFEKGLPVGLNGNKIDGCSVLMELNKKGAKYGVGRGIHIGDTILGIKGRIAFEAPGATILISAHRELEKLVLTKAQMNIKDDIAQLYGQMLHEGQWFDPAMRNMEALIDSSQQFVSGEVRVKLHKGNVIVEGCKSPFSLFAAKAKYGEGSKLWTGKDAEGFCKIYAMQSVLAAGKIKNG